jgi:O-antigen ligase
MGTGLDSYRLLIPKNAPAVLLNSMHCHNIFLNLWLETGLFGVLSFVWISLRAAFTAVRRLQYSSVRPCLSAGIGMVAATFIHGIMDASLVSSQTLSYFGLFLACLVVMNRKTVNF